MFGRKRNNMSNDLYFVVRVWYFDYKDTDKYQYNIVSDRAYPMDKAVDIKIIHHSLGELVGRDSWHKNREAFISKTELPLQIKE